jgi:hypothetical protein
MPFAQKSVSYPRRRPKRLLGLQINALRWWLISQNLLYDRKRHETMDKCPSVEKKEEKEKEKCKIKMIAHDLCAWRKLFIVSKERYLFQGAK